MNRIARTLLPALAVLRIAASPALAQDISGNWLFTMDSPDGAGQMDVPFTFEQDGSDVSGTVDLSVVPMVQSARISDGVFEDGILFFLLHVSADGQFITIEVEAELDGEEMIGDLYIAEMGQAVPFTGKRPT